MRGQRLAVPPLLPFVVLVLSGDPATATRTRGLALGPEPDPLLRPVPAFQHTLSPATQDPAVEQDPPALELALGLDRATRRLIQQGLHREGFDPGAPDGLFGPRTRGAIHRWQQARGLPPTGYLDGGQAELLRASAAPRPTVAETSRTPERSQPRTSASASPPFARSLSATPATANCDDWNTSAFFQKATVSHATACLAAGADPTARDADRVTPLHWAASDSNNPDVIDALLAAGGDLEARDANDSTPLQLAARNNGNPAVLEALLTAGANLETRTTDGRTVLHLAAQSNRNPAAVGALLSAGVDVTARNADGLTAAHLAAQSGGNPAVLAAIVAAEASFPVRVEIDLQENPSTAQTQGTAPLPPEIMVDRHLVRMERLLAEDNAEAAHAVMDQIVALQNVHGLALPDHFRFQYAQVAFGAGLIDAAITSLNEYLVAVGRTGQFYREALELLDSAEEALRREEVERRRLDAQRRAQREDAELVRRQLAAAAQPFPPDRLQSGGVGPEMVRVPTGRFQYVWFGYPQYAPTWVSIDKPFAIAKYEVTRGEFQLFAEKAGYRTEAERTQDDVCVPNWTPKRGESRKTTWRQPGFDQTANHPVTCVTVVDAMAYAEWLSRETGNTYRLPSSAEWQYAARGGSDEARRYVYLGERNNCGRGNLEEHPRGARTICTDGAAATSEVGRFPPNKVGLHDMIGNVSEWVLACAHLVPDTDNLVSPLRDGAPEDPRACEQPLAHGASYQNPAYAWYAWLDSGGSWSTDYGIGFRLVRELHADRRR